MHTMTVCGLRQRSLVPFSFSNLGSVYGKWVGCCETITTFHAALKCVCVSLMHPYKYIFKHALVSTYRDSTMCLSFPFEVDIGPDEDMRVSIDCNFLRCYVPLSGFIRRLIPISHAVGQPTAQAAAQDNS